MEIRKIFYNLGDKFRGVPIQVEKKTLLKTQWYSKEDLISLQNEKLNNLIKYVYNKVPFYSNIMKELKLSPNDIHTRDDLQKLPVLTKGMVRDKIYSLKSIDFSENNVIRGKTGGSTGEPLEYFHDRKTQAINRALHHRGLSWSTFEWGDCLVAFMGGTLGVTKLNFYDSLRNFVTNQTNYPAFEINPESTSRIYRLIKKKKPKAIIGYTSSLYYLSVLLMEQNFIDLEVPIIFTTGEVIFESFRQKISETFHGKVYDYYGFGEIQAIAYQCPKTNFYHLSDEKVILELLPIDEKNPNIGRAIFTDLSNYSFPFIRYECGDVIEITKENCQCGRNLSLIKKINGRTHDFIKSSDGKLLAGEFFPHLMGKSKNILYYQVIQEELNRLKILYVPKESPIVIDEIYFLTKKIKEYTSIDMEIEFVKVDSIPRTNSGKLRVTISKLNP